MYISGGIAPQLLDFLASSPLRRRFEEKGALSDYVKEIPILMVLDAQPGLTGAMYCLAKVASCLLDRARDLEFVRDGPLLFPL